jgi:hypothetical protein
VVVCSWFSGGRICGRVESSCGFWVCSTTDHIREWGDRLRSGGRQVRWRGRCALPTLVIRLGVLSSGKLHKPIGVRSRLWPWRPSSLRFLNSLLESRAISFANSAECSRASYWVYFFEVNGSVSFS